MRFQVNRKRADRSGSATKKRPPAVVALFLAFTCLILAKAPGAPPTAGILQTGDLIWPKAPGAVVPYNSTPGDADSSDARRWKKEKDTYLEQLRRHPNPPAEERARYTQLSGMTYKEFVAMYLDDHSPEDGVPFGAGGVSVGHVGIIEVVDGVPTVIEAMVKPGVRRISYSEWLQERPGELIWLGRLKNVSAKKRAAVARAAAAHIGKPYRFWNFNLKDDAGFYCSKLAWLSIVTATGVPPDDKPDAKRILWFSPKQLMKSPQVSLVVNPGSYGSSRTGP